MTNRVTELMSLAGIKIQSRRALDDHEPDGYLESDRDLLANNEEAAITLLEGGLHSVVHMVLLEVYEWTRANGGLNSPEDLADLLEHFLESNT